jgi:leucyl-tRNA---protein transferase
MFKEIWNFIYSLDPYDGNCSYFPEKANRARAFRCSFKFDDAVFDDILAAGFRRCGDYYYFYECTHCYDCEPYRIILNEFYPDRSLRRNLKTNRDLSVKICLPAPSEVKEQLYLKYFKARHNEDEHDDSQIISIMYDQMYTNFGNTDEIEIYDKDNCLIGFAIVDRGLASASAVYSVFDPGMENRGLGNYIILQMITQYQLRGYKYLYLGLLIRTHQKMSYKSRFRPGEVLDRIRNKWTGIDGEL